MKITQSLRKPSNWQDFESLCLLLWREEWKSDDIKKNGRLGQNQDGVDICGHYGAEIEYSGIQCKCKSESVCLTIKEIDEEIDKAKGFKPSLRRFVIATTAKKDVSIEEYVRIKDYENRESGLFSIDIKSWDDIVEMLERNKSVLNRYLDIVTDDYLINITFDNNQNEISVNPSYAKINYFKPISEEFRKKFESSANKSPKLDTLLKTCERINKIIGNPIVKCTSTGSLAKTNNSFVPLSFIIHNLGKSPIDNYRIVFDFECEEIEFKHENVEDDPVVESIHRIAGDKISFHDSTIVFRDTTLNPADKFQTDKFYFKVPHDIGELKVSWTLTSRHYSDKGELKITVDSEYIDDFAEDEHLAGQVRYDDYIE